MIANPIEVLKLMILHRKLECNSWSMNQPIHTYISSCINLIFVSQFILVMETGVHLCFHQKCHHQIIYAKRNPKIHYLPSCEREVWYDKHTNTDLIQRVINYYPWKRSLAEKYDNPKKSMRISFTPVLFFFQKFVF